MFEVHTGIHPGKPSLALMVSGASLVAALGIAWVQVAASRAMSPPRPLAGTPLMIRVPAGWEELPSQRGVFAPHSREAEGAAGAEIRRIVEFKYARSASFVSPAEVVRGLVEPGTPVRAASIGEIPGVEVRLHQQLRMRRGYFDIETLIRVACSPRGDLIQITYTPRGLISAADEELFDAICAGVSLAGIERAASVESATAGTGLTFEPARDWVLFHTTPPATPGVYVLALESGVPAWALGVLPTWLSPNRLPRDLLADFGAVAWGEDAADLIGRVTSRDTAGGLTTAEIRHRGFSAAPVGIPAAHLVVRKSHEAALVLVFGDTKHHAVAASAADELARHIEFDDDGGAERLAAAERAGQGLAGLLSTSQTQSLWGSSPAPWFFAAENAGHTIVGVQLREPRPTGAQTGYVGREGQVSDEGSFYYERWELGATGEAFEREYTLGSLRASGARPVTHDARARGADRVTRKVTLGTRVMSESAFDCGAAFVSPPLELAAAGLFAARHEPGSEALIEVLSVEGGGLQSRRLRCLPRVADRGPRLVAIDDYWPDGILIEFAADQLPVRLVTRHGEFRRLTIDEAQRHLPLLEQLYRVLPEAPAGGFRPRSSARGE